MTHPEYPQNLALPDRAVAILAGSPHEAVASPAVIKGFALGEELLLGFMRSGEVQDSPLHQTVEVPVTLILPVAELEGTELKLSAQVFRGRPAHGESLGILKLNRFTLSVRPPEAKAFQERFTYKVHR